MAEPEVSRQHLLQEHQHHHEELHKRHEDCLSCKVIGTVTFLGLSGYSYLNFRQTPKTQIGNRLFLGALTVGLGAVGVARAFWTPPSAR